MCMCVSVASRYEANLICSPQVCYVDIDVGCIITCIKIPPEIKIKTPAIKHSLAGR